jgi:hypothetical protein
MPEPALLTLQWKGQHRDLPEARAALRQQAAEHFRDRTYHISWEHDHGFVSGPVTLDMSFKEGKAVSLSETVPTS